MTHDAANSAVHDPSARTRISSWLHRPEVQVYLLAFSASVLAIVFALVTPDAADLDRPFGSWTYLVIMVMFGLSEVSVFTVHFRREGISFSLNEVPLAFAVVFLGPFEALLARLPLSVLIYVFLRDNRRHKLAFNVAIHMFELALAVLLFNSLAAWWGGGSAAVVIAVTVSLGFVTASTSVVIALAISLFDGVALDRIATELRATWWLYTVNAVLAGMTVALTLLSPALALLALPPIVGMWYVLHSYGRIGQELRDLDAVHGFADRVGDTLDVTAIGTVAVDELARVFRASGAVLVRFVGELQKVGVPQ